VNESNLARVRVVKAAHERELLRKANVVGVGIGRRSRDGQPTDELAIIVSVTHKVPLDSLHPRDIVPRELEGVPVDVQAVGVIHPL